MNDDDLLTITIEVVISLIMFAFDVLFALVYVCFTIGWNILTLGGDD